MIFFFYFKSHKRCYRSKIFQKFYLFFTLFRQAKKALQEQLELSRQLTEKQRPVSDSEEEEEETRQDDKEDDTNVGFGSLVTDADNPWSIDKTSNPVLLGEEETGQIEGMY